MSRFWKHVGAVLMAAVGMTFCGCDRDDPPAAPPSTQVTVKFDLGLERTPEEQAKADARIAALKRRKVVVKVERVALVDGDATAYKLTNASGKDLKGFSGGVHIYDQFEDHVTGFPVKHEEPLADGESVELMGGVLSDDRAKELLRKSPGELTFTFIAEKLIYLDGTSERFE